METQKEGVQPVHWGVFHFRKLDYVFAVVIFFLASAGWTLLYNAFNAIRDNEQRLFESKDSIHKEIREENGRIHAQLKELRQYLIACPPRVSKSGDQRKDAS